MLQVNSSRMSGGQPQRRVHMRTIGYFAGAVVLILIGLGIWTVPTTHAFVPNVGIDPAGMMAVAKDLPTSHFHDYSLVFN
jgi:hypothetical protein